MPIYEQSVNVRKVLYDGTAHGDPLTNDRVNLSNANNRTTDLVISSALLW